MNLKSPLGILTAAALLAFGSPPAHAQQYGPATALWNFTATNNPAVATNLGAISGSVTLTKYDHFALQFEVKATNAMAGTLDVRWDTSLDGVAYPANPALTGASGWFSVPLTNAATSATFVTNITVNSVGYWRINWLTNASGQHLTNVLIRAYLKPKRNG